MMLDAEESVENCFATSGDGENVLSNKGKSRIAVGRVGSKPIPVPSGVTVLVDCENRVSVEGPLGKLAQAFRPEIPIEISSEEIRVLRPSDAPHHRALHGLTRALLNNMVVGVTEGYNRPLELVGTGYRVQESGRKLVFQVGYSHPVEVDPPEALTVTVESPIRLIISGSDKQLVGQFAANIRAIRPPDAYKGKGIRYAGEQIRLKPGKKAARAA